MNVLNTYCEKCIIIPRSTNVKKFGGLPIHVIGKITHKLYKDIIDRELLQSVTFKTIESRNARAAVYENTKNIFHNLDLSRYGFPLTIQSSNTLSRPGCNLCLSARSSGLLYLWLGC